MSTIQIPPVEPVSVSLLKVDGQNPNRMTKDQHERLATSIKKYGFIVPIITNRDLLIADGEQRFEVAKSLGMAQVPVIRLEVEDVDRRLLRQVLNKLRGEHELIADALEFEKIIGAGREDDLKHLLDLNDSGLERYLKEIHPSRDEDYEVPEIEKVQTDIKRGDILQLGKHRLMCGDATSKEDITSLVNGEPVSLIFTDSPYNVEKEGYEDNKLATEYYGFSREWFALAKSISDIILFTPGCGHNLKNLKMWFSIEKPYWMLIWVKNNALTHNPVGGFQAYEPILLYGKPKKRIPQDVYICPITVQQDVVDDLGEKLHSTPKQRKLWVDIIEDLTAKGEIITDMFGGSGTTLIACEQTGRICYMMEIDPRYCQVITDRWEIYTGQKAVKTGENNVPANSNREDS